MNETQTPSTLRLSDIVVGDRLRKEYGDLSDLDTITTIGLIQPIVLVIDSSGQHCLVAGGRRFAKLQELEVQTIHHGTTCDPERPGYVYRDELPEDVRRECELYENIGRKAMSWQERTLAIAEIHQIKKNRAALDRETWGQAETGAELGVNYSYVSYALTVAKRLKNPDDPLWKCDGLTAALRVLTEERMDEAKHNVAKLTAGTIPVQLNESNEQETEIAVIEAVETGQTITVPLSRMLLNGDMVTLCQKLGPETVDHIVSDWPYGIDMDNLVQSQGMNVDRVKAEHDHIDNVKQYPIWLKCMFDVLKPKSFCVIWYDNVHWQTIRDAAEHVGFRVQRWPLIWIKSSPCLNQMAHKNWTKATEQAIVLSKQNATLTKPQPVNYWSGPRVESTSNLFAKPKGLWQWVLSAFALQGDIILDPFMGEGSATIASIDFGCRPIGFEINENHFNQATINVRNKYEELTRGNVKFV